ncbi:unnamed protein product [Caenorhabditis angaria]|uniref:F-box domain-containing protein n=1 Tax=Caenorhabditis angaria TaxID=860376 RepID=A0A9P1MU97_9PELO|nr:unnamed protein product [Caenorhabditis angaria]
MAGWHNLPEKLKLDIFRLLEKKDRLKFAKCSFGCLQQVLRHEKNIESLGIEKLKLFSQHEEDRIYVVRIDKFFEVKFKQIGELCEIEHRGEFFWKTIGDCENMAYGIFERVLAKNKDSLNLLTLYEVDYMIQNQSIDNFSRLETLDIITNRQDQLYSLLSKAENIKQLIVDYRADTEQLRGFTFTLSNINYLDLSSQNNEDLAFDILHRIDIPENKKFESVSIIIYEKECTIIDDPKIIDIFKKSDELKTSLILSNDQFIELATSVKSLKLNARQFDTSKIIDVIMSNGMGICEFTNVNSDILKCEDLNLNEIAPNKFTYKIDSGRGSYDISSGTLIFYPQGFQ